MSKKNDSQQAIEAAVFRRLIAHLDENKSVQNIDLMNLAISAETVCLNGIWQPPKIMAK